jgi:protein SCO1/2
MPEKPKANPTTLIVAAAIALLGAGGIAWVMTDVPASAPAPMGVATGDVQVGQQPYSLQATNGEAITEKSFPDKIKLVYFGFTRCPDVCPPALNHITDAMAQLGQDANRVQPIFVTVDPDYDTLQVIKDYLYNFDKRIVGATGIAEELKKAQESFRVFASVTPEKADGAHDAHGGHDAHMQHDPSTTKVQHSDHLYVLSANNQLLNVFDSKTDGATIAQSIQVTLAADLLPKAAALPKPE